MAYEGERTTDSRCRRASPLSISRTTRETNVRTVCHAVGGTDDHVHLAVSIPPTVQVSDWVGRLKGASAHYVNQRVLNKKRFAWQAGYGVVSFGSKDLPWVNDYIRRQRDHHASDMTHSRLERIEADPQS